VVEWSTLQLLIRQVLGSDLLLETGYLDRRFSRFPQSLQANAGIVL
jgi:hypothetical protein